MRLPIVSSIKRSLWVVGVSAIYGMAWAQGVLIDDFNDGNDDGWTRVDYTQGTSFGPAVFDLSAGAYRISSTGAVPPGIQAVVTSAWGPSAGPEFQDGYVRVRVKLNSAYNSAAVKLRTSLPDGNGGYYFFANTWCNCFGIQKCVGNDCPLLGFAGPSVFPGEEWFLEAGAVGDTISLKVWRVGAPEPDEPQVAVPDQSFGSGGFLLLAVTFEQPQPVPLDLEFDDVYFRSAKPLEPCFVMESPAGSPEVPLEVLVDASCSHSPEGSEITSYAWNFGDGETAEGVTASHVYFEPGRHVVTLTVTNDTGEARSTSHSVTVNCPSPDGGEASIGVDVGSPLFPGISSRSTPGGCVSVCAGGKGILGRGDESHFVYEEREGDFVITATVPELSGGGPSPGVGLMARESLDPGSRHASVLIEKGSSINPGFATILRFRADPDSVGRSRQGAAVELPGWIRLERRGTEFIGYQSPSGQPGSWSVVGEPTAIDLPSKVLVGIAATGKDPSHEDIPYNPLQARVCLSESGTSFVRGRCNDDDKVDISDAVCILQWLFLGGSPPGAGCTAVANTNGDGGVDLSDGVYLLGFLFLGGCPPVAPFPECGPGTLEADEVTCDSPPAGCRP
jgi:PKD repeat protein